MTQPEDSDVSYQIRKIGRAATLLSLDSVVPFYPFRAVPAADPEAYKTAIRQGILDNRRAFQVSQSVIPGLQGALERSLEAAFGAATVCEFRYWLQNIFIYGPAGYRAYSSYTGLLLGSKNFDDQWIKLELPERISDDARAVFIAWIDSREINELDDKIREKELSDGDVDMYTRHGLNEEFKDPWVTIDLMFTQLRYRQFMGWLIPQLTHEELQKFYGAAAREARLHKDLSSGDVMPHPLTQLLPDAHAIG